MTSFNFKVKCSLEVDLLKRRKKHENFIFFYKKNSKAFIEKMSLKKYMEDKIL